MLERGQRKTTKSDIGNVYQQQCKEYRRGIPSFVNFNNSALSCSALHAIDQTRVPLDVDRWLNKEDRWNICLLDKIYF